MGSIRTRIAVIGGAMLLVFSGVVIFQACSAIRKHVRELTARQAELALEFDPAVREYIGEKVRPFTRSESGHAHKRTPVSE